MDQTRRRSNRTHRRRLLVQSLERRDLLSADFASLADPQSMGLTEFRSFDGSFNNLSHPQWGVADGQLLRLSSVEYGEGTQGAFPALAPRLDSSNETIDARTVSNVLMNQDVSVLNDRGLTGFTFQWGQFLDHDMDLTEDFVPVGEVTLPGEFIPLFVTDPADELPVGTMVPMLRSRFEWDDQGVAQQINQITAYIDASNVYGSSDERASALRAGVGGLLLTSDGLSNLNDGSGEFLPLNTLGLENAAPPTTGTGEPILAEELFVAGDVRANEQPGLTSMHTLFMREHNFQASRLAERFDLAEDALADPRVDEYLFQLARAITNAEIQSITYNEFLPSLLGPDQLPSYEGYRSDVNAGIANIFSASLYRVGHTMLPSQLMLLNDDGSPVADDPDVLGAAVKDGKVALADAFFNRELITQYGIEAYLKGLAEQQIEEIDHMLVDEVRNLLFDPPAAVDLGATNLQRGRDHGLPDYNQARVDFGLDPVESMAQISSDPSVVSRLEAAYDQAGDGVDGYRAVDNIDVFAGAISEDHLPGGSLGELLHTVLVDQFTRLRDGDRFYYENAFSGSLLNSIRDTRLADVIRRNSGLTSISDEVFRGADVLTYRGLHSEGRVDVLLRARGGQLEVVDSDSGQVVATQSANATNIVVLFGASKNDRFTIDASVSAQWAGAVEVHGGGRRDRLVVERPRTAEDVDVETSQIQIDDLSVFFGNVESVRVKRGPDNSVDGASRLRDQAAVIADQPILDFASSQPGRTSDPDVESGDRFADDVTASVAWQRFAIDRSDSGKQTKAADEDHVPQTELRGSSPEGAWQSIDASRDAWFELLGRQVALATEFAGR